MAIHQLLLEAPHHNSFTNLAFMLTASYFVVIVISTLLKAPEVKAQNKALGNKL